MSHVFSRGCTLFVVVVGLGMAACASPSRPSSIPSAGAIPSGVTASALGTGANAGWTCLQPPGVTGFICAPPGLGLPPIPPAADGQPTYNITAFTLDHQFVHRIKLLRPDLYHGEPCLGGDPWTYIDFLDYYECIIPGRGE